MCGIAGKVWHDGARPVDVGVLRRMAASIRHRGPDDEGIWTDPGVGLAHRRLAVIDLSPRGHQPMASADGTIRIVFNGEIYNHRELRRELESRGRTFRSESDTEVLLQLYEDEGVRLLDRLRGMFAFAIWDGRTRTLFAARDRLGKKPFHYLHDGAKFLFASEPRAILLDPEVSAAPDGRAIGHYLTFGYVPGAFSALRGLAKLPPAHYLLLHEGRLDVRRYATCPTPSEPGQFGPVSFTSTTSGVANGQLSMLYSTNCRPLVDRRTTCVLPACIGISLSNANPPGGLTRSTRLAVISKAAFRSAGDRPCTSRMSVGTAITPEICARARRTCATIW